MSNERKEPDYTMKFTTIGDSGVGKSAMILRKTDDSYAGEYISTIGVDFKVQTVASHGKTVNQRIWDLAGQERLRTMQTAHYGGATGAVFCYDPNDRQSFTNLKVWLDEADRYASESLLKVIVCTKCDTDKFDWQVNANEAREFAESIDVPIVFNSAKDPNCTQVQKLNQASGLSSDPYQVLTDMAVEIKLALEQPQKSSINLTEQSPSKPKRGFAAWINTKSPTDKALNSLQAYCKKEGRHYVEPVQQAISSFNGSKDHSVDNLLKKVSEACANHLRSDGKHPTDKSKIVKVVKKIMKDNGINNPALVDNIKNGPDAKTKTRGHH